MMIPKEQQSAYQRWEMAFFGDDRPSAKKRRAEQEAAEAAARAAAEAAAAAQAAIVDMPQLALPSVEELEAIREAARLEGFEQGLAEGRASGHAEGFTEGAREGQEMAERELAQLRAVADSFAQSVARADETIAHEMLDLALRLAHGMARTAFATRPELVLDVVRDAVAQLPALQKPVTLTLHPDDAELVRAGMADDIEQGGWRIAEDPAMERGGCQIETPSNRVDAQASVRWQRLTQALGSDLRWMES